MGQSLSVEIVYGMVLPNEYAEVDQKPEDFPFYSDENDWYDEFETWVERQAGVEPLDHDDHPGYDYTEEARAARKVWEERNNVKEYYRLCNEARKACPFDITFGGVGEWAEPVLYVKATAQSFYDGVSPITERFNWNRVAHAVADAWANQHGIPWKPDWLVVARYG